MSWIRLFHEKITVISSKEEGILMATSQKKKAPSKKKKKSLQKRGVHNYATANYTYTPFRCYEDFQSILDYVLAIIVSVWRALCGVDLETVTL